MADPVLRWNVRKWLLADIQPPEIDFRFTPNTRHSEAHAGLPVLTRSGHSEAPLLCNLGSLTVASTGVRCVIVT